MSPETFEKRKRRCAEWRRANREYHLAYQRHYASLGTDHERPRPRLADYRRKDAA